MNTPLDFVFGLLGSIVSFMVFLAQLPTFYKIYKKKSTEGFQSVPYDVVGLFSEMLWIYYEFLKTDTTLLITINSIGCLIQSAYICFFLFYAPKYVRVQTVKLVLVLNVVGFCLILTLTYFLAEGSTTRRANIVGWICLVFSLCVFVPPLCVLRQVIKTRSVEYMPFLLSFFLTLRAVMWFFYGLLRKDYNIAIPNVLGFSFGVAQMVVYLMYKNGKKMVLPETQVQVSVPVSIPISVPNDVQLKGDQNNNNVIDLDLDPQVEKLRGIAVEIIPVLVDNNNSDIILAEKPMMI